MADWWTPEDKAEYEKLCASLVAYYDGYEIAPGIAVDGEMTLAENTADLGGLSCALAMLKQKEENPDYNLFFTAAAKIYASTMPRDWALYGNDHSPDKARVNKPFQAVQEFYDTFGIKPGDGMYISPEQRVRIW
jgi:putative endopeptidase